MHTIYIFGLGPSDLGEMPKQVYETISKQEQLYLRTKEHPAAQELLAEGMPVQTFDAVYEKYDEEFEQVYPAIVDELLAVAETEDVYYGVPGHPAVAETSVQLLREANVHTEIIGGKSFIDDLFAAVEIDPIDGFQLVDSFDLNADEIITRQHVIVMQVFHSLIASDVKLALLEIYPPEHQVGIVDAAGSSSEQVTWVPLYELDHFDAVHNLRSVYVPPLKRKEAVASFTTTQAYIDEIFGEAGDAWAKSQNGEKLLKHFQSELDELKAGYENNDINNIVEELGDLLMQILYQTAIGEKKDLFSLEEVVAGLNKKIYRRHPHVFGDAKAETIEEVEAIWQKVKEEERKKGEH